eukprot:GHVN01016463.1.p2 GENE.GHVN01016463.1~~GHVN01016463.1.p2  ORF type:complete len:155 (-),score=20.97 GHVN01016463.1:2768-3232(-)
MGCKRQKCRFTHQAEQRQKQRKFEGQGFKDLKGKLSKMNEVSEVSEINACGVYVVDVGSNEDVLNNVVHTGNLRRVITGSGLQLAHEVKGLTPFCEVTGLKACQPHQLQSLGRLVQQLACKLVWVPNCSPILMHNGSAIKLNVKNAVALTKLQQ